VKKREAVFHHRGGRGKREIREEISSINLKLSSFGLFSATSAVKNLEVIIMRKEGPMDIDRRDFLKGAAAAGVTAALGSTLLNAEAQTKGKENIAMKPLKFFIDTHDRNNKTFPAKISPVEFEGFYAKYEKAMYEEGVIPVRVHVGYNEGRAFCLCLAPDADSVKRAHDRVGLPYDSITEVAMATPGDTFFRRPA
jgi:hypothetical protein